MMTDAPKWFNNTLFGGSIESHIAIACTKLNLIDDKDAKERLVVACIVTMMHASFLYDRVEVWDKIAHRIGGVLRDSEQMINASYEKMQAELDKTEQTRKGANNGV